MREHDIKKKDYNATLCLMTCITNSSIYSLLEAE